MNSRNSPSAASPEAADRKFRLAVVVISYKQDHILQEAFANWYEVSDRQLDVFLISNSPEPSETDVFSERLRGFYWFRDNPGYFGAFFRLLRAGHLTNYDLIFLTNADVYVENFGYEEIRSICLTSQTNYLLIGPRHSTSSSFWVPREPTIARLVALVVRDSLAAATGWCALSGSPSSSQDSSRSTERNFSVHGSCMAMTPALAQVLSKVSPMVRLYGEEVLLGWLIRSLAGTVRLLGETRVVNAGVSDSPPFRVDYVRLRGRHRLRSDLVLLHHKIRGIGRGAPRSLR